MDKFLKSDWVLLLWQMPLFIYALDTQSLSYSINVFDGVHLYMYQACMHYACIDICAFLFCPLASVFGNNGHCG